MRPLPPARLRNVGTALAVILAGACSDATGPGVPTTLAMVGRTPATAQSGVPFAPPPILQLRNAAGGDVRQAGVAVLADLAPGGGALAGTTSVVTDAEGRAVFTDLAISGSGAQVLQFSAPGLDGASHSTVLPTALANGITIHGLLGAEGSAFWYVVAIPEHASILTITAAGGLGRADLHVRYGALPSLAIADCPTVFPITTGHCTFVNPAPGHFYILLSGFTGYSGLSLTAAWQTATVLAVGTEAADTARSGVPFARQPVVQLLGGDGALRRQRDVAVSAFVASGGGVLGGTTTLLTDDNGRAVYHDLALIGEGEHTLQFRAAGVAPVVSAIITLPSALFSSAPEANLSGAAGSTRWYEITVPAGAASLAVRATGGTGNADLYLRFGGLPSTMFDCASTGPGTTERCDIVSPAAGAWYVLLSGTGSYSGVSLSVPTGVPCHLATAGDSDGDRIPDCAETNTGVFVGMLDTGTDPHDPDTDADNLPDGDEVLGTLAGLNLPAMGVSPLRRDILVEYDWFDDALDCNGHSHRPTAEVVAALSVAFANGPLLNRDGTTGIHLVSDHGQGGVFTGGNLIADADGILTDGVQGADFQAHRSDNFAANRVGYFHYALLPHRIGVNGTGSGEAELPGFNLIVSLYCANSDVNVAATIMHELGHNLMLHHGGFEVANGKPNYNSVMNYRYQFTGVDTDCTPQGNGFLSYSTGTRPPLDENILDEAQGVCGSPPGPGWDWNGDGDTEDFAFAQDLDDSGSGLPLSVLRDHRDWQALVLSGQPGPAGLRVVGPPTIVSCLHAELPWAGQR